MSGRFASVCTSVAAADETSRLLMLKHMPAEVLCVRREPLRVLLRRTGIPVRRNRPVRLSNTHNFCTDQGPQRDVSQAR
jgi:hypothetical protein